MRESGRGEGCGGEGGGGHAKEQRSPCKGTRAHLLPRKKKFARGALLSLAAWFIGRLWLRREGRHMLQSESHGAPLEDARRAVSQEVWGGGEGVWEQHVIFIVGTRPGWAHTSQVKSEAGSHSGKNAEKIRGEAQR